MDLIESFAVFEARPMDTRARHMKISALIAPFLMLLSTQAVACVCQDQGLDESGKIRAAYNRATRIILVQATSASNGAPESKTYADILSTIKGPPAKSRRFTIYQGHSNSMCGMSLAVEKGDYALLYLTESEKSSSRNPFHACSRSRTAKRMDELSDELAALRSVSGGR